MPQTTCGNDGWEMIPSKLQIIKPTGEVRVWLECPRCKNCVVDTYSGAVSDIKLQVVD